MRVYNRRLIACLFILVVMPLSWLHANNAIYPLPTAKQDAQFKHLLTELRCLVCQNQDLADSNAGLALDLREKVYNMVRDNRSDQEIIDYLTTRYGDFILFKPPMKSITLLLWFAPFLFLGGGLTFFLRKFKTENPR